MISTNAESTTTTTTRRRRIRDDGDDMAFSRQRVAMHLRLARPDDASAKASTEAEQGDLLHAAPSLPNKSNRVLPLMYHNCASRRTPTNTLQAGCAPRPASLLQRRPQGIAPVAPPTRGVLHIAQGRWPLVGAIAQHAGWRRPPLRHPVRKRKAGREAAKDGQVTRSRMEVGANGGQFDCSLAPAWPER